MNTSEEPYVLKVAKSGLKQTALDIQLCNETIKPGERVKVRQKAVLDALKLLTVNLFLISRPK